MRVKSPEMAKRLAKPDTAMRLYFLFGPDNAGARSLAQIFADAMPPDAERIDLSGAQLKSDPARLPDEVASFSLFGGARYIYLTLGDSGEDAVAAVDALLQSDVAGNPVIIVGGAITATSKLAKLIDAAPQCISCICYAPNAGEMASIIRDMAAGQGMRVDSNTIKMITDLIGDDRALAARELEKLALYLDASTDAPKILTPQAVAALGADVREEDVAGAIDAMLGGKTAVLSTRLADLESAGVAPIRVLRSLTTRAELLARLRPDVDRGMSASAAVDAAGKTVFYREKDTVADQLRRWPAARIARLVSRINDAEAALKAPHTPGFILLRQMAADIARQAARS
jgi:DNA polymerase III subunit delta